MKKFDFYLDQKITAWMREYHTIEAETIEEAREKMIQNFIDNGCASSFISQEFCYGTENPMMPDDNGGQPTQQLFDWLTDEVLIENSFISDEEE
jgi:hypothetical protein